MANESHLIKQVHKYNKIINSNKYDNIVYCLYYSTKLIQKQNAENRLAYQLSHVFYIHKTKCYPSLCERNTPLTINNSWNTCNVE